MNKWIKRILIPLGVFTVILGVLLSKEVQRLPTAQSVTTQLQDPLARVVEFILAEDTLCRK